MEWAALGGCGSLVTSGIQQGPDGYLLWVLEGESPNWEQT